MTRGNPGPDIICPGMQKAGTAWLYDQFSNCPAFWMPPVKELCYFAGFPFKQSNMNALRDAVAALPQTSEPDATRHFTQVFQDCYDRLAISDADYLSYFAGKGDRLSADISPVYSTMQPGEIRKVHQLLPNVQIVLLIRNPVDRLKSAMSMHVRKGKLNEKQLADWKYIERLLKRKNYSARSFPTRIWKNWLSVFGADQCSFYLFDDIAKRPDTVLTRLGHKFGFDPASISIDPDHNRKAGSKKVEFTNEINENLQQYFSEELKKMEIFTEGQI